MGPIRLNLSKSGMGVSTGIKGLRVSSGPRGTYLNAGRQGLYYRKKLSGIYGPTRATLSSSPLWVWIVIGGVIVGAVGILAIAFMGALLASP